VVASMFPVGVSASTVAAFQLQFPSIRFIVNSIEVLISSA
jgi:hypothetical protein